MFDPSIIFHRTQAGRDEIQQKSHGLTQSERLVLIMVDGVSTYQQVRSKLPVLADDRFQRAVQKLQAKELILEVFLPVEGQNPEELERTVIDRFLQQDPLDPVTIMFRDPEEELEYLAQFSNEQKKKSTSAQASTAAMTSTGAPESESSKQPATANAAVAAVDPEPDFLSDVLQNELVEQFARELKERQVARPDRPERSTSERESARRDAAREARHKPAISSTPQWAYWLIALGCAFIAGYMLARFGT